MTGSHSSGSQGLAWGGGSQSDSVRLSGLSSAPQMCEQVIPLVHHGLSHPSHHPPHRDGLCGCLWPPESLSFLCGVYHYKASSLLRILQRESDEHRANRKDALGAFWDLARLCPFQVPGSETANSLRNLSLEKRGCPSFPAQNRPHTKKCFPGSSSRESEGISVAQREFIYCLGWQQCLAPSTRKKNAQVTPPAYST